jgi:hypothetical protein
MLHQHTSPEGASSTSSKAILWHNRSSQQGDSSATSRLLVSGQQVNALILCLSLMMRRAMWLGKEKTVTYGLCRAILWVKSQPEQDDTASFKAVV